MKITSDNSRLTGMVSGIGGPEFDLCTIGASDPAYTVLAGLGFPLGDDLKGATSKSFDIAGAMKLLYPAYEGTHAFAFEITDAKGLSARASLTLTVDPANEGPSIVGVDFNIDETQTPSADRDTEIDITAQTGIKSLDVTIDCDNLDAKELGTMGIPAGSISAISKASKIRTEPCIRPKMSGRRFQPSDSPSRTQSRTNRPFGSRSTRCSPDC